MIVVPVYIAPLFDDYGRMRDRALEQRIARLAARAGIPDSRIYEVRKSAETRQVNAYVTGFGGTKRIVLWDTLVDRLQPDEVEFVVGHEIGHFVLRHTLTIIVAATLLATLSLWVVHRVAGWLIARFRERFGFDRLDDVASMPLLALVGGVVILGSTPAALALSRWQEREADRFGLEITRDNNAAARAFVRLQMDNLAVPRTGLLFGSGAAVTPTSRTGSSSPTVTARGCGASRCVTATASRPDGRGARGVAPAGRHRPCSCCRRAPCWWCSRRSPITGSSSIATPSSRSWCCWSAPWSQRCSPWRPRAG